jgi:hypothetical protein
MYSREMLENYLEHFLHSAISVFQGTYSLGYFPVDDIGII